MPFAHTISIDDPGILTQNPGVKVRNPPLFTLSATPAAEGDAAVVSAGMELFRSDQRIPR
jgi:hypothetical protein